MLIGKGENSLNGYKFSSLDARAQALRKGISLETKPLKSSWIS